MTTKRKFWVNLSAILNKKGFTLIELVITMGLIGILLLGAVTIFSTASRAFVSVQVRNEQQLLLDGMVESIASELRYSTNVTLNTTASGGIYTTGEDLYMPAVVATGPALSSNGHHLDLQFERQDAYTLVLTISLTDTQSHITTKDSTAIRLINCEVLANPLDASPPTGLAVTYATETN